MSIKKIFCRHEYKLKSKTDDSNIYKCKKCKKIKERVHQWAYLR